MNEEPPGDSLSAQASHGYRTTLLSQAIRVLCKAVSVVTLARLVTPADHGRYAMAASAFYVVVLFRDCGLGTAALQARELSEEQRTTLWHAHVMLGFLLALIALALSPVVAVIYHEPQAAGLLAVMSVGLLLIGLNAWPRALLTRELRFADVNQLETLAAVIGTLATIGSAALGAGGYAFAIFLIVSEGVALVEAWRRSRWRARAPRRWSSLRGLWRTGSDLTLYNLLLSLLSQIDTLLMGRWFGASALGLYNRPNQLLSLPMQHVGWPLTQVMFATLARSSDHPVEFAGHVRRTANLIAHLTLPLAAVCIVLPEDAILLLLGKAWPAAAPLLRWLGISAVASYLTSTVFGVCVATQRTRRLVAMTLVALVVTATALWIGRTWGPEGLAAGIAIANALMLIPRLWWATQATPLRLCDYGSAFVGPLGISCVFGAGLFAGSVLAATNEMPTRVAIEGATGIAAVAALALLWPGTRSELKMLWQHLPFRAARNRV